jgi:hypothetical protein
VIRIVIDPFSLKEHNPDTLVVTAASGYVASRLAIRDALRADHPLDVIVTSRQVSSWYGSLREYPGVTFEEVTPSGELRKRLSKHAREDLTVPLADRDIAELRLIEMAQSSPPNTVLADEQDLKSWVLSACIDPVWGRTNGSPAHAAELATHFLTRGDVKSNAAIERLKSERRQSWMASSLGKLYQWLLEKPAERAFLFYVWQVSQNYSKTMRDKVLKEYSLSAGRELASMAGLLGTIGTVTCPDAHAGKEELGKRLELLWKQTLKEQFKKPAAADDGGKFKTVVATTSAQMSGRMQGEFDALKWFAGEHMESMTQETCELIAAKFAWVEAELRELCDLVPPRRPDEIPKDADWPTMKGWVVQQYFPYRRWLLRHARRDRRVDELAERCSLWIHENYPTLKNGLEPLVYGTWSRISALARAGHQVLWVVIDNLSGLWVDLAVQALAEQGFHLDPDLSWRVAMLPSETATSKSALIAGRLPNQIPMDAVQKYERLFADACKDRGLTGHYVPTDGLKDGRLANAQVTCCVVNKLDTKGHEGFYDLEPDIRHFLDRIAAHVRRFVPEETSPGRFRLVVSTDHGACHVPRGSRSVSVPTGATATGHRRFIETLVPTPWDDRWYVLDADSFALHRHVAVVKGYAYIGRGLPTGLIHGGLTPEEVVIPHLEFALQRIEPIVLKCRHSSEPIMGMRKRVAEFKLANYNDVEVTDVFVSFPSHCVELEAASIRATEEVEATCELCLLKEDLARIRDNVLVLEGFCSFRCRGEVVRRPTMVEIHVKRIMEGPSEAEQLLGL